MCRLRAAGEGSPTALHDTYRITSHLSTLFRDSTPRDALVHGCGLAPLWVARLTLLVSTRDSRRDLQLYYSYNYIVLTPMYRVTALLSKISVRKGGRGFGFRSALFSCGSAERQRRKTSCATAETQESESPSPRDGPSQSIDFVCARLQSSWAASNSILTAWSLFSSIRLAFRVAKLDLSVRNLMPRWLVVLILVAQPMAPDSATRGLQSTESTSCAEEDGNDACNEDASDAEDPNDIDDWQANSSDSSC